MASVFSKIIAGEIPCYKVAEDDNFLAFMDIMPLREGHVLIVPKVEVDRFFDVPAEILAAWLIFAKPIAKAIEHAFPCNRCGMSVIGLEVAHAHMHLLPIDSADDLNFTRPKLKLGREQLMAAQQKISKFI
ncbi:MAG: HIT family protein [Taibaiella sp.]|nr:HIT family protein [Taibaiella sp.]